MDIKEGFFWKNYCYFFTADAKKVEHPRNLCNYFWTSVFGMGKAFGHAFAQINAFCYLLLFTAFFFASYGICYALPDSIISFFPIILMLSCFVGFMVKSCQFLLRLIGEKASAFLGWAFIIGFGIFGIGIFLAQPPTWQSIEKTFSALLLFCLYALGGITIGVIIIALGCFLFKRATTTDFFKTIITYLIAKKRKICPLVQPPESFKEKI